MDAEDINDMVKEVITFLEKILDVDKLYLSDFLLVHKITHKFKNNFTEELNIVYVFVYLSK